MDKRRAKNGAEFQTDWRGRLSILLQKVRERLLDSPRDGLKLPSLLAIKTSNL